MNERIAIQLMLLALTQAQQIATLLNNAKAQGRDVTSEELDGLAAADVAARKELQDVIDAKQVTP